DRVADTYELHPAHAHFHYVNFAQSRLWVARPDGRRKGDPIRVGRKNGFCMIDVENVWFGRKGDGARTYYFPRCNAPTERDSTGLSMVNGISPGWADVYNWFLADQFIEASELRDGCYVLQTRADPKDTIVESDETNNANRALLRLDGDEASFVRRAAAKETCRRR
ncbi:MAG: lysyl oxidase family protein, partial [Nitriliruptorales bacterium]